MKNDIHLRDWPFRNRHPLAAAGLVLSLACPASTQDMGLLEYPDTALIGMLSAKMGKTQDECHRICVDRTGCVAFDWTAATNACRIFATVGSAIAESGTFAAARMPIPRYHDPSNGARPPVLRAAQSSWLHNGNLMSLRVRPSSDRSGEVSIVYDVPRQDLERAGIRSGTTLFEGTLTSGTLAGKARLTGGAE